MIGGYGDTACTFVWLSHSPMDSVGLRASDSRASLLIQVGVA